MYVNENRQEPQNFVMSIVFKTLRWLRNYFILIGVLVTILMFSAIVFTSNQGPTPLASDAKVFLNLKLEGDIKESNFEESYLEELYALFSQEPRGVRLLDMRQKLDLAAQDPRVQGLFLEIHSLGGSLAAFTELRGYLEAFKESKKPIFAWFAHGNNSTYYLASVANKIFMAPVGDLSIPGPSFQLVYFGKALRNLGVNIEVVRAGKFKSAFEPFILNEPSLETREMYNSLKTSLLSHLESKIAPSRQLKEGQSVNTWYKQTLFDPIEAKTKGLVDHVTHLAKAKEMAFKDSETESYSFFNYDKAVLPQLSSPKEEGIALIEAIGEIHLSQQNGDRVITPEQIGSKLDWALEESHVKAVVLRISSPGGSASASDMIWSKVKALALKKPVVVSMGGVAASGGYYIASPAHKIFADDTTITGSIGVIGMLPKLNQFDQKYGINFHMISNSNRKQLLNPGGKSSKRDRKVLGNSIDIVYQMFLNRVAEGRKLKKEDVHAIAQGRVWTGAQAKNIGLVDEIGGLWEAIQEAKKLANLDLNKKYPLLRWKKKVAGLSSCLANYKNCVPSSYFSSMSAASLMAEKGSITALENVQRWATYLKDEPIQAIWFGSHLE